MVYQDKNQVGNTYEVHACLLASPLKVRRDSFNILNASLPVRRFNSTCLIARYVLEMKFIKVHSRFMKKKKKYLFLS